MIADLTNTICRDRTGKSGTGTGLPEEQQNKLATHEPKVMTVELMDQVCLRANLVKAYKRVRANKGSAGVDGMSIDDFKLYLSSHSEQLFQSLRDGSYRP